MVAVLPQECCALDSQQVAVTLAKVTQVDH
jgi:hypothetical protein